MTIGYNKLFTFCKLTGKFLMGFTLTSLYSMYQVISLPALIIVPPIEYIISGSVYFIKYEKKFSDKCENILENIMK
jgi:hypothetical protein